MSENTGKFVTLEEFENYKKIVENMIKPKKDSVKEIKYKQPNAYALFLKEMSPKLKSENPNLTQKELFKKVAELWNEQKKSKEL